jgi:hypothetical protein
LLGEAAMHLSTCIAATIATVVIASIARADGERPAPTGLEFEAALGGASNGFAVSTGALFRYSIAEIGALVSARTYLLGSSSVGFTPALGVSLPLNGARIEILGAGGLHHFVGCQNGRYVDCLGPQTADGDRAFLGGWIGAMLPLRRGQPPYIGVWVFVEGDLDQRSVLAPDGGTQLALGGWQIGATLRAGFDFLAR